MIQEFHTYIVKENLFHPADHILLAVSGGVDSAVMVELFSRLGYNYSIAHCNFTLRGKESDKDEIFVENLAQQKGVQFFTKKFETKKYASNHSISIQMAARDLRNEWLVYIAKQNGFKCFATAHHLDDQIETFFINLLRGTGISGLHGIKSNSENLIHPMLFTYRKNIEDFARQENIEFRIDSSNLATDYTRNKIRHQLIPVIKDIKENYQDVLTDNIYRFSQIEDLYRQFLEIISDRLIEEENDGIKISIKYLINYKPTSTVLFELIQPYGFNFSQSAAIVYSIGLISGKQFYSKTHRLVIDREYIIIQKIIQTDKKIFYITEETNEINEPISLKISRFELKSGFVIPSKSKIAILDIEKLSFPLRIRKWKQGDYFYPLGMKKRKLLSNYFIDNKFSILDKESTWIMTSGNEIIWIIGHRIDDRFKVTNSTQQVFEITLLC
jgi:tRNA(Ile)-lysidine synthase